MFKKSTLILFNEHIKMSDVILTNTLLLDVLPHLGITTLGWQNQTIQELCAESNVSLPVFLLICNLYTFDEYDFINQPTLEQIPLDEIIRYLHLSHQHIMEVRLPQIHNAIIRLERKFHSIFGSSLSAMGATYEQRVITHMKYEEEQVFPRIMQLLNGEKTDGSCISESYNNNHSMLEAGVSDLNNIILNYFPRNTTITACHELLFHLFVFEYMLRKHCIIEDLVVVPLVTNLEAKYDE